MSHAVPEPDRGRPARGRAAASWTSLGPMVLGAAGILAALLLWQLYSTVGPVDPEHLPPPTIVLRQFFLNLTYVQFWVAIGHTLWAWFLGLVVSAVSGFIAGLVIGSSRFLREATHSTIEFLRPIPSVGLIPLAALLFGPRIGSELMIIVYACFWIVLIQVLYGIADIDKVADDTVRTMRMGPTDRAKYLVVPTLLPYLVTGIRLTATVALILAISVELIVGTPGLGHEVAKAQINGSAPALIALILTSGVFGISINTVMRFLERRVLFWHSSVRSEVAA